MLGRVKVTACSLMRPCLCGIVTGFSIFLFYSFSSTSSTKIMISLQVYDMQFELNEIEARREHYPSTISFVNLVNALISEERDLSDKGRR